MTARNCFCGVSLQQASQYVGILDMVLGGICTIILVVDACLPYRYTIIDYDTPTLLIVLLVNAFVTQVIMGMVLRVAASNKSRSIMKFWLFVTAFTAIFTGLPIRVFEMLIVSEFSEELKKEAGVEHIIGELPSKSGMALNHDSIKTNGADLNSQQQAGALTLTIENGVPGGDESQ